MSDDDRERFEDYLELERYIEDLQAGRASHLPQDMTPDQARIYQMAVQFCAGKAIEPREQFVQELEARLLAELAMEKHAATDKHPTIKAQSGIIGQEMTPESERVETTTANKEPATVAETSRPEELTRRRSPQRVRFISRRALLAGGAVAAASLTIGSGVGAAVSSTLRAENPPAPATPEEKYPTPTPDSTDQPWLVENNSNGITTTWHFVTTLAQLGSQVVQFAAGGVIGYVILNKANQKATQSNDEVIAISAACTHMGCIVQWQAADRNFHCPCHGGMFTQYGLPNNNSPMRYLAALPRLHVKIDNGNIYVEVPKTE